MKPFAIVACAVIGLAACREEVAEAPQPVPLTEEAVSFFCQMNVLEHGGPKAQIHLQGQPAPLFFAQARDAIAYLKSPERDARVTATYLSDMGVAVTWNEPGAGNWIAAGTALFVVEADVRGGMGAPEVVPFADRSAALAFTETYGGRIVTLEEIPDSAVLGPVDPEKPLREPS